MIYQKLNETDIATLRSAILTPSGKRFLDYIEDKNSPAFDPEETKDANHIAFKAAYNQGYKDALKFIIETLTPSQLSNNDMMNASFQSPNDTERTL